MIDVRQITEKPELSKNGFFLLKGRLSEGAQKQLVQLCRHVAKLSGLIEIKHGSGSFQIANAGDYAWLIDKKEEPVLQPVISKIEIPYEFWELAIALWTATSNLKELIELHNCMVEFQSPSSAMPFFKERPEVEQPMFIISLGCSAWFELGRATKRAKTRDKFLIESGDIIVLSGESLKWNHGFLDLVPGTDLYELTKGGTSRVGITLRQVVPNGQG